MTGILKFIISIPQILINHITIYYRNVNYEEFPKIYGILSIRGSGRLEFGKNIIINSCYSSNPVGLAIKTAFYLSPDSEIIIGENVGISNTLFYSKIKIIVEKNVLIGGGCQIYDSDFHSIEYNERIFKGDNAVKIAPVIIREGAFIGASVIILKGVVIGKRSVIAAGSVVTKSVPDDEIWGGNPAVFIRNIKAN